MPKKQLFDENEKYTVDASDIQYKAETVLKPIMKEYMDKGYSIRDINLLLHYSADCVALMELM